MLIPLCIRTPKIKTPNSLKRLHPLILPWLTCVHNGMLYNAGSDLSRPSLGAYPPALAD